MNVLSLFDGMSCCQQALDRLGIKVDNYYASEIDKYAIQATMANYPNTKQLGSVVDVDGYSLPQIDLLAGGSPCQSFSFAGKRKGMAAKVRVEYQYNEQEHEAYNLEFGFKDQDEFIEIKNAQLNKLETFEILTLEHYLQLKSEGYEFEGQSYLFWEFMRLLKETKPRYFLLENVMMGEKWEKVLTKAIGVNPIEINSSLVSAQSRRRLYWTNIGMAEAGLFGDLESFITKPRDKKILLKDVLQKDVDEKYFLKLNANQLSKFNPNPDTDKAGCLTLAQGRAGSSDEYMDSISKIAKIQKDELQQIGNIYDNEHNSVAGRVYTDKGKSVTLSALGGGGGAKTGLYQIIAHDIPEMVSVRKHEVDVLGLQALLNDHKKRMINFSERSITINEIVEKINFQRPLENHIAKTEVEHWFRMDSYFSIPSPEHWIKLKEVLGITTDEFDAQVMEFIEKESVFEKTNRVYDEEGISPTLTSTGADERVLVRNMNINDSQSGAVHDIDNKSVPLCANGGGQGAKTGLYLIPNEDALKGKNRVTSISPYQGDTLHYEDQKMQCLPAQGGNMLKGLGIVNNFRIRRLTPIECCRLQTVKDDYFFKDGKYIISETQVYKCCGNGWTVDVISHIFSYILKKQT